ncbi:MAG: hypothetical protein N3G20_03710 [Verrucomicrobiae bacterium]|nr:hypothetical protein [Verrucomicrobiae bacterium]
MKRVLSFCAKALLVLAVVVLLLGLSCLAPVDTSTWTNSVLGVELESALRAVRAKTNVLTGELRAGFGRARLTPELGAESDDPERGRFRSLPLAGYGARRGRPATGVHDELWAKAVALAVNGRTGVVVTADALIIPRDVAERAAAMLADRGIGRDDLYFGATHTHSSIGGWGMGAVAEAFAGKFVPAFPEWFARRLAAAARAALDDMAPASAGVTCFQSSEHVRNRLVGNSGPVDPRFRLIVIVQEDGDRAVIGSYSAHATVLPAETMSFSGDYPGAWAEHLERSSCKLAMFMAGGVGSHAPRPGAPAWEGIDRMGRQLAVQTRTAVDNVTVTNKVAFGLVTLKIRLPQLQVRLADKVKLRPWLARLFLPVGQYTRVQALRLAEAVWLSTPCDFSGELAMDRVIPPDESDRTAVTSFNGDYVGYVIPSKYYHMRGYEPRTMSFYGPQLPDYMSEALRRIADVVRNGKEYRP